LEEISAMNGNGDHIGVFDVNYETGEQYWSTQLREMLGVPLDVPAEFHLLLERLHPDDRRFFAAIANSIWQPECPATASFEIRVVPRPEVVRVLHVEACTSFRPEAPRDALRTVGLIVDVTHRFRRGAEAVKGNASEFDGAVERQAEPPLLSQPSQVGSFS
jgi:PAS domain-containing protein